MLEGRARTSLAQEILTRTVIRARVLSHNAYIQRIGEFLHLLTLKVVVAILMQMVGCWWHAINSE